MEYFPLFFKLKGKRVVVIGGGAVAARKLRLLLKSEPTICLIAPDLHPETQELVQNHPLLEYIQAEYHCDHLQGSSLVFACTSNKQLNQDIADQCQQNCIFCNVVDQPELCTAITPAIVDRSPVVIAISSGASAPVLARRIRIQIEQLLPQNLGQLARFVGGFRRKVSAAISDSKQRLRLWENIIDGPAKELVLTGREEQAKKVVDEQISATEQTTTLGEVYLVGAGPGDPELLTLKALRLMQQADVVLYDRLVSDEVMELVRRDADRIYVGKRRADHSVPQKEINLQLAELALQGKRVLRLKGGDPFIFGRGGEELETLAEKGVNFQVVPGITAASGCSSYSGIPLTHRDHAQSVRFITGHLKDNQTNFRWTELAASGQTLVFYMGLMGLDAICSGLVQAGRSPDTPAAIIEKGTTPQQRVITGDLGSLPSLVAQNKVRAPTLLIIGGVVSLYPSLNWYKNKQ